jgi:glycolate oxidase iron-sulfur subunit
MRTNFSPTQLADPALAAAERSARACVHCGICTATCPTYVLLGDERDGPRGRIVMMQQMLEEGGAPAPEAVLHVDRCLSCLACRTACPSSVDYAALVDAARAHIETHHRRPLGERLLRWTIAKVMTRPVLVRIGLAFAPLGTFLPGRLGRMARIGAKARRRPQPLVRAAGRRVGLMRGCVQAVLAPEIDAAVSRVLARRGIELVPLDAGCCGSLAHHMGRENEAKRWAARARNAAMDFDTVLISATGCSTHLKDAVLPQKAKDFLELVEAKGKAPRRLRVAWQAPCSLQNGLRLADKGRKLLIDCGYEVLDIAEGHLCCGSAGSYSILQPQIADALRARKLANIAALKPDAIATANIGCLHHLGGPDAPPIVHLAELVDWADGGAAPDILR